ncbi:putative Ras-related protein Rab-7A [Paratrimastix pyriformis]|uniref:Ras-related protein Rab-7A n=1 Tax=Paratrimastix pyriformis TaxID=342808 RepID=A0ABQ8UVA7_9EUKA|nr:putative Ras-related protein Rab-7A [Paratrimastix pyriformis]
MPESRQHCYVLLASRRAVWKADSKTNTTSLQNQFGGSDYFSPTEMADGRKTAYVKVIFLGDQSVGKTSLLNQFIQKRFQKKYKATLGSDFFVKEVRVGETTVVMQIWDTAGQERFRSLGSSYFRGADLCCLVYDVTVGKSFDDLDNWKEEFLLQAMPPDPERFPFFVIANKVDLPDDQRMVTSSRATEWIRRRPNFHHVEASAKSGDGVDQAFLQMATVALERNREDRQVLTPVQVRDVDPPPSKCC